MSKVSFAAVLAGFAVASCGSGTSTEPRPTQIGELSMTIARAQQSAVPSAADSALVRVWNASNGVNVVRQVHVPDPGATTTVSVAVPAGAGYSVAVLAYRSPREALAGGVARDVVVNGDATTAVTVSVVPWTLDVAIPDTLIAGAATTITATFTQGPVTDFLSSGYLYLEPQPWTSYPPSGERNGSLTATSFSASFNAPSVTQDTTVWYQFMFAMNGIDWNTPGSDSKLIHLPNFTIGDSLFSRPIRPASGSVVVSFNRNQ